MLLKLEQLSLENFFCQDLVEEEPFVYIFSYHGGTEVYKIFSNSFLLRDRIFYLIANFDFVQSSSE